MNSIYQVGVAAQQVELTEEMLPLDGFTKIHDSIFVRVVIFELVRRVALVTIDITNIPEHIVSRIKQELVEQGNMPENAVWVIATHSTGLPHTMVPHFVPDAELFAARGKTIEKAIIDAGIHAIHQALSKMQEARLFLCKGKTTVNICRDVQTKDGWWVGLNPEGPSDSALNVLRVDALDDSAIAVIYNLELMPEVMEGSVMEDGGRWITSDMCGAANTIIEQELGGTSIVAMFCPGASGDQEPVRKAHYETIDKDGNRQIIDLGEQGFLEMKKLGGVLAQEVLCARKQIVESIDGPIVEPIWEELYVPAQKLEDGSGKELAPCHSISRVNKGLEKTGFGIWQFGRTTMIGMRPALTDEAAAQLKNLGLLFGGVNGAQKCMAIKEAYDKIQYGTLNTCFAQGAAELFASAICAKLRVK